MSAPYPWQGRPWRKLQNQVQNKSLPHAMLLYGQSGLGKLDFSEALVRSMLCDQPDESGIACGNCQGCRLLAAGSHPDFCYVSTEDESQQIKIDQIRALNEFMELTRQCARYKIGLISKAEALNQNAANSLLKTLEEPPLGTLILLVSSNVGRLPATLRSRCQHVLFTLPKRHESSAWLRTHTRVEDGTFLASALQ